MANVQNAIPHMPFLERKNNCGSQTVGWGPKIGWKRPVGGLQKKLRMKKRKEKDLNNDQKNIENNKEEKRSAEIWVRILLTI